MAKNKAAVYTVKCANCNKSYNIAVGHDSIDFAFHLECKNCGCHLVIEKYGNSISAKELTYG